MEQGGGKLTGYGYVQPSIGPSQNMEQGIQGGHHGSQTDKAGGGTVHTLDRPVCQGLAQRGGQLQPQLIDLAYSTDCCHLVEGVVTDAQLGRFCTGNGFVPEAEGLSDKAFELLDFAKIGREFCEAAGGGPAYPGWTPWRSDQ